jgi:hypothetical protein
MTRDDIIEMAKEAKLPYEYETGIPLYLDKLEHFLALARQKMQAEVEVELNILMKRHEELLGEMSAMRERT